jgi:hypothetical protein
MLRGWTQVDPELSAGFPFVEVLAIGERAVELINRTAKMMEVAQLWGDTSATEEFHRCLGILASRG